MFPRRSCPPVPPRKGGLWKAGAGVGCTHVRCGGLDPILQTASDLGYYTLRSCSSWVKSLFVGVVATAAPVQLRLPKYRIS